MKILTDTGVISRSSILVGSSRQQALRWGKNVAYTTIAGFERVELQKDPDQQHEADALFTVGRLAREGKITVCTYSELVAEIWRGSMGRDPLVNAFVGCVFQNCASAIERSKFRQTVEMGEWFAKGGMKDRDHKVQFSHFSQMPYFEWLSLLSDDQKRQIESHASLFNLDDFELESLHDLDWYQNLTKLIPRKDDLPDCFHLWTARRNDVDVFLTLEKKLPKIVQQLRGRHKNPIDFNVAVLRPTELLHRFGVAKIDPVPIDIGRFYTYAEVFQINDRLLHG